MNRILKSRWVLLLAFDSFLTYKNVIYYGCRAFSRAVAHGTVEYLDAAVLPTVEYTQESRRAHSSRMGQAPPMIPFTELCTMFRKKRTGDWAFGK